MNNEEKAIELIKTANDKLNEALTLLANKSENAPKTEEKKEPTVDFDAIQKELTEYARKGYMAIIREAIEKRKANKLSEVKGEELLALVNEVRGKVNGSK